MSCRYISVLLLAALFILSVPNDARAQADESIQGSLCVGFDCQATETFDFKTIYMKENNLRLFFEDTSNSGSFPSNDWQIRANESENGGANLFAFDDVTNDYQAFVIEAASQDNALVVSDTDNSGSGGGYVGVGIADPQIELHLFHGDSPGIRMEQDGTEGFGNYAWDVAGNETNFFVRDVTGGASVGQEIIPFRIYPGASNGSLTVSDNSIGIGTTSPTTTLHLQSDTPGLRVENTSSGTDALALDENGNLTISGVLTEASSMHLKENRETVNTAEVLETLKSLPVETWNYRTDEDGIRHMGPMAQTFYAAFGLGVDEEHLAPLDVNGVALAAIQELLKRVESLESEAASTENQVQELKAENQELSDRIARLERLVEQQMGENADVKAQGDAK
ncbi:hypothetical protein CRI94_15770 [Longibacter salinarum]|uniref:Peptidase S74 domain-containing protein n=1 Tax=Longibacter salinarum TaxID=1850348 RepID=A0A2A8CUL5_9BACT|nr:tail fiber domain-containing protein [Longibacter salinarum]PEN11489.1 hypothetical protein CRI94_15770 [Longibacter salinarum]